MTEEGKSLMRQAAMALGRATDEAYEWLVSDDPELRRRVEARHVAWDEEQRREDWREEHERITRALYALEGKTWEPPKLPLRVMIVRPEFVTASVERIPCPLCERLFTRNWGRASHERQAHGRRLKGEER